MPFLPNLLCRAALTNRLLRDHSAAAIFRKAGRHGSNAADALSQTAFQALNTLNLDVADILLSRLIG
jgi:hypothetical protein